MKISLKITLILSIFMLQVHSGKKIFVSFFKYYLMTYNNFFKIINSQYWTDRAKKQMFARVHVKKKCLQYLETHQCK